MRAPHIMMTPLERLQNAADHPIPKDAMSGRWDVPVQQSDLKIALSMIEDFKWLIEDMLGSGESSAATRAFKKILARGSAQ